MAQMAMLLLDGVDEKLSEATLVSQMKADWPSYTAASAGSDPGEENAEGPFFLDDEGYLLAFMVIPAAIPDDLSAVARSSRLWPEANEDISRHTAHVIATIMPKQEQSDQDGHTAAIDITARLSRAIASFIGAASTVRAVYWSAAEHVIDPGIFREMTMSTLPTPLLPLWVALNVGAGPDGNLTGHTRGLAELSLPEIEIHETPEDAATTLNRIASIADYLLSNGAVIGDGDTIGSVAEAEIVARHTPSVFDEEHTALRLSFMSSPSPVPEKKRRGWFRR